LPRHLVLTSTVLGVQLGVTAKAAHTALDQLAEAGIVLEYGTTEPKGRGRPADLYVCPELLALAGSNPLR
jgi:predicted ArsR family transcriptional regulator